MSANHLKVNQVAPKVAGAAAEQWKNHKKQINLSFTVSFANKISF